MRAKDYYEDLHEGCNGPCCNQTLLTGSEWLEFLSKFKGPQAFLRKRYLTDDEKVEDWILDSIANEFVAPTKKL